MYSIPFFFLKDVLVKDGLGCDILQNVHCFRHSRRILLHRERPNKEMALIYT